jgi:hypothetical protein
MNGVQCTANVIVKSRKPIEVIDILELERYLNNEIAVNIFRTTELNVRFHLTLPIKGGSNETQDHTSLLPRDSTGECE